jgi:hypothetical protein
MHRPGAIQGVKWGLPCSNFRLALYAFRIKAISVPYRRYIRSISVLYVFRIRRTSSVALPNLFPTFMVPLRNLPCILNRHITGNILLHGIPILQDERRSRKYGTKETIAAPKHIPVPMRRTTSTPRRFAHAGLLSMAKRFMTPKKVSTMKMRGNLCRLFIDCLFNCSSDSRRL